MSHMQKQVEFGYWIIADGNQGTEVIPGDLVSLPDGYTLETAAELLRDYLESSELYEVEERSGYCARLSAPAPGSPRRATSTVPTGPDRMTPRRRRSPTWKICLARNRLGPPGPAPKILIATHPRKRNRAAQPGGGLAGALRAGANSPIGQELTK